MEELYEYRRRLIDRYRAVADDLAKTLESRLQVGLNTSQEDAESSPKAVIAHLYFVERGIFFPFLQKIMDEELPCLYITQSLYEAQEDSEQSAAPHAVLEKFQQLRTQQVGLLLNLPSEVWNRCARHNTYGVRTFQWWVEQSLAHVEGHLRRG